MLAVVVPSNKKYIVLNIEAFQDLDEAFRELVTELPKKQGADICQILCSQVSLPALPICLSTSHSIGFFNF